ncbi:Short Transient Receptor Potential Channel 7 [Manis pentadactyla]|nr:Short Transient Receptor Potential Channel 7 [Manis pentadactyla]
MPLPPRRLGDPSLAAGGRRDLASRLRGRSQTYPDPQRMSDAPLTSLSPLRFELDSAASSS